MLADVSFEHHAGLIGESLDGDAAPLGVDGGHPPAVAVADLVDPITVAVIHTGLHSHGGVVVAADDDVAGSDVLIAGHRTLGASGSITFLWEFNRSASGGSARGH